MILLLLQIDELLKGHVNTRGIIQLIIFAAALAVVVGFSVFIGLQAFKSKK